MTFFQRLLDMALAPMTAEIAAGAIVAWLTHHPIAFALCGMRELDAAHFEVQIRQVEPVHRLIRYQLCALEVSGCYEVKEVAA